VTPRILPRRWDIFCTAIDNYGDVGVAWRLARQLVSEHGMAVRLFVDVLAALARIAPEIDARQTWSSARGVDVHHWSGPQQEAPAAATESVADVVVEAFGCGLPAAYLEAMCALRAQPLWINLEYLSAETWVEECHGLASRQPRLPLVRYFYFPGFTQRTGGLLRERGLFARRDAFRPDPVARAALWRTLNVEAPAPDALTISLFCYPNPGLPALFDAWADGDDPIVCVVPDGVASAALDVWTGGAVPHVGETLHRGRLSLARVPFVEQDDYDRLLWACDLNVVRGEDSFVRAQWAARPLVWHSYPQTEDAHIAKLEAFLARYGEGLGRDTAAAQAVFARAWNQGGATALAWDRFARALPALGTHADAWARTLAAQTDLVTALVSFTTDRV
jgi:uncharacterized repeat protein (TIGR03837 family)